MDKLQYTLTRDYVARTRSSHLNLAREELKKLKAERKERKSVIEERFGKPVSVQQLKREKQKRGLAKRKNNINFSQQTRKKVRNTLESIYIFTTGKNYEQKKGNCVGSRGHLYTFKFPDLPSCQYAEITKNLWTNFVDNFKKVDRLNHYCWALKFDDIGKPYYLLYCDEPLNYKNLNWYWDTAMMTLLADSPCLLKIEWWKGTLVDYKPINGKADFDLSVLLVFMSRNKLPYSGCKLWLARAKKLFRHFGRSQGLADCLPVRVVLNADDSRKFDKMLRKHSQTFKSTEYYTLYYLNRYSDWYQATYMWRLYELLKQHLSPYVPGVSPTSVSPVPLPKIA